MNDISETHMLQKAAENQCQTSGSTCFWSDSFHINGLLCTDWTMSILTFSKEQSGRLLTKREAYSQEEF